MFVYVFWSDCAFLCFCVCIFLTLGYYCNPIIGTSFDQLSPFLNLPAFANKFLSPSALSLPNPNSVSNNFAPIRRLGIRQNGAEPALLVSSSWIDFISYSIVTALRLVVLVWTAFQLYGKRCDVTDRNALRRMIVVYVTILLSVWRRSTAGQRLTDKQTNKQSDAVSVAIAAAARAEKQLTTVTNDGHFVCSRPMQSSRAASTARLGLAWHGPARQPRLSHVGGPSVRRLSMTLNWSINNAACVRAVRAFAVLCRSVVAAGRSVSSTPDHDVCIPMLRRRPAAAAVAEAASVLLAVCRAKKTQETAASSRFSLITRLP